MSSAPGAATRYERYALIFDPANSRLGSEALGLVERGVDPLYASDLDEAHLLALQEAGRVGALVVPGTLPLAQIDLLLERIGPHLWAGPASIVIAGPPSDRSALRALADRGLSWVLREPYDAAEFRFVVSAALATEDKLDPRSGLRVPVALPVTVTFESSHGPGIARNLSIGGAYVAHGSTCPPGSQIRLTIGLGDHPFRVDASVVYCQERNVAGRAVREPGAGIAFRGLDEASRTTLAGFIEERINCFRL